MEIDLLLEPYFGDPCSPYICPAAQLEVYSLLATFQHLNDPDIGQNVSDFPFIAVDSPLTGGIPYHSNFAILAVQMEIQRLGKFGPNCPALAALPSAHTICDLKITYQDAIDFTLRITKF
eukprot:gene13898-29567_t